MTSPLVSVCTPAYNAAPFLPETIEGILNQTYTNFEYIIVNDCSTDRTREICQEYAARDSRIKFFDNEENLRIAKTRNRCVSLVTGKYLVWQDADDISLPIRLEKLVEAMERDPQLGICGSHYQCFDETGDLELRKFPSSDQELRKIIFKMSPVSQPTVALRKQALDKLGLYDESFTNCEDLDMTFRIGQAWKLGNVPEVLVRYRIHPNSTTQTAMNIMVKDTLSIRKKYASLGYQMSLSDKVALLVTRLSLLLPPKFAQRLFSIFRSLFVR